MQLAAKGYETKDFSVAHHLSDALPVDAVHVVDHRTNYHPTLERTCRCVHAAI